jgi:oxygen-dependent protoporphyrinogen oxidase
VTEFSAGPSSAGVLDTLVVGAGISGLTAALRLTQRDRSVLVLEHQERVGGCITTASGDGFLWEEGPNSFAPTPELLELAVEVGLKDELVFADGNLPRYVYWNGELLPVPMTPGAFWRSRLLSEGGKLRLMLGALGFTPPAMGPELAARGGEETIREFFSRHLGSEAVERLVSPFVSGVYAGDIDALSASAAFRRMANMEAQGGGLVGGAMRVLLARRRDRAKTAQKPNPQIPKPKRGQLGSFRQGIQALPEAIAAKLGDRVKLRWRVEKIHRTAYGTYAVDVATPEGLQLIEARSLLLTVPTQIAADLLWNLAPEASQALQGIYYPPVACVIVAYPTDAYRRPLDGFGNLIPRSAGIKTLGTIWASTLFPGRAPEGWAHTINFIGGATYPDIAQMTPDAIAAQVDADLRQILLKPDAPEPKVLAVRLWRRAIPQYEIGHLRRLDAVAAALERLPGLHVYSNYVGGVSVGDCIKGGAAEAARIDQVLEDLGARLRRAS